MKSLYKLISSVETQLKINAIIKALLLGVAANLLCGVFFGQEPFSVGLFTSFSMWLFGVFKNNKVKAIRILHQKLPESEYSLELLQNKEPNIAHQLQLERLQENLCNVKPPQVWFKGLWPFIAVFIVIFGISLILGRKDFSFFDQVNIKKRAEVLKKEIDAHEKSASFLEASIKISPPAYTGLKEFKSSDLNISAIIGSSLLWQVTFSSNKNLKVRLINSRGEELPFKFNGNFFSLTEKIISSGLYAIRAYQKDSIIYQSDYYKLEAIIDAPPRILPQSKELYSFHFLNDPKSFQTTADFSDDFAVTEVYIVATLARGSGEGVKFRELKIPVIATSFKEKRLSQIINLNAFDFTPGDELYYYWAAVDNRKPEANLSKSDTYFVVYKDTAKVEESDLLTMAVNVLPEYFRSQRQIIIDTEKLISRRNKLKKPEFNAASNEIGFDQKALRIRYGQYLGEEYETSIGGDHAGSTEDPLEGFVHKHDSEEEEHVHPVTTKTSEEPSGLAEILAEYGHSHDNAEANTFYEVSTRSILKTALENMWKSELHLRMYEPEKALPFEHKALELLKEVQQKARVFIAKSSYDPPPIRQKELRMKGELKKFNAQFSTEKQLEKTQVSRLSAVVLGILERGKKLTVLEKQSIATLSNLLIIEDVNFVQNRWRMAASLQKLLNDVVLSDAEKGTLKVDLHGLVAVSGTNNSKSSNKELEKAFWQNVLR